MECISVNFLAVIVYCNYVRCSHWDKLGERYMESLCNISYKHM